MRFFRFRTIDELKSEVKHLGLDEIIKFDENLSEVFKPIKVGRLVIGNRFAVHPMEGCDGTLDGKPDELTFRRWERFGGGGAKLVWGEATAVVEEGRANPRQLLLNEKNLKEFALLVQKARKAHREIWGDDSDLVIGIQLTHSGRWSYKRPIIAFHNPVVDSLTYIDKEKKIPIDKNYPVVSDDYLERLEDKFVKCAKLAFEAGFQFVDIKQCHTYLLNELLAGRTRDGKYGGDFLSRTRFIRNVVRKIKSELGDKIEVASRINVFDCIPFLKDINGIGKPVNYPVPYLYGFGVKEDNPLEPDLTEPIELIKILASMGVKLINISMGSPYYNPHIGRPFETPPIDGYKQPEQPLFGVARHFKLTSEVKNAVGSDVIIVGTGYSYLREFFVYAAEANIKEQRVSIVGVGRGALAYPDFFLDLKRYGKLNPSKVCITISHCTNLMRSKHNELGQFPAGCVPRDKVYAKIFQIARKGYTKK
ncbi:2,4-dienoyl-CoA reductase [Candidatus Thermokryptus mobilis]|uniref:2,4-dienoyl-CoA reductase n=1 Tax=Candidatus Thermokryptus mobilis TaxID=1643428 RepID=A0A0S4NCM9_9BACT|nr:NADH:flavin oxidoreductase [Candidatus Thermokryptus mobilis]CUU07921.1 2,4-dienoyl-CoA reductase [Candidatus Thermokryptus mobilis]